MFHIYSYGRTSPMKLILTDRQANLVNRFTRAFFEAQNHFLEKTGKRWTPDEPISFNGNSWSKKDNASYNRIAKFLTFQYKIHNKLGTPMQEEDLHDDFLVRN